MKAYLNNIKKIRELIDNADYILVGAGAGLSASGGINYLDKALVKEWFPEYKNLNLNTIVEIQSAFWNLSNENVLAYWGYWARHIYNIRYKTKATKPYLDLYELLKDKEHFIITTNIDGQFEKAGFKKENIFTPQGDYALFQCSSSCSNKLYDNKEMINTMALNTSLPLYRQLKRDFPEVVAVNAMYTHGIGVVISTKSRFGGYGKAVAMRLLSTPHGMPYSKIVIVVDEFVDPFNLEQVMWALTIRVRPDKDVVLIPNAPGMPLDPSSEPAGMHTKLIIDATTPVAPDKARETELLEVPEKTDFWSDYLKNALRDIRGNK